MAAQDPTNVLITTVGTTALTVNWTDNATGETYYKVERREFSGTWGNGGTWGAYSVLTSTGAANLATYADTGLTAGTAYQYRISATDGTGTLVPSSGAIASDQAFTPPATTSAGNHYLARLSGDTSYRFVTEIVDVTPYFRLTNNDIITGRQRKDLKATEIIWGPQISIPASTQ